LRGKTLDSKNRDNRTLITTLVVDTIKGIIIRIINKATNRGSTQVLLLSPQIKEVSLRIEKQVIECFILEQ
jgi:hypothetical protein